MPTDPIDPLIPITADQNPSSDTSGSTQSLSTEAAWQNGQDPSLPEGYDQSRLVLLPVNAQTQHLYWEISRDFLIEKAHNSDVELLIKIYLLEPSRRELETIPVQHLRGSTYTYHKLNLQKIEAVLIARCGEVEIELLASKTITTPSSSVHPSPWEIWITKGQEGSTTHSKKSVDAPTPEALTSPSSLDQVLTHEQLQMRLGKLGLNNPSSDHGSLDHFSSDTHPKKGS